ncbi:TPA: Gp37 family protein [Salmonella enterica]
MNTLNILNSTVARLQDRLPALDCELFPDDPGSYRLNHDVGALLVSYSNADFGANGAIDCVMQEQPVRVVVTLVFRELNTPTGAIQALDETRRALAGFRPAGCHTPYVLVSEKCLGFVAGVWQFSLIVQARSMFVQDSPDESQEISPSLYEEEE